MTQPNRLGGAEGVSIHDLRWNAVVCGRGRGRTGRRVVRVGFFRFLSMAIRIISFLAGAIFGAVASLVVFHVIEDSLAQWGIIALAAPLMGLLAALFGRKLWDVALNLWP
jgi:hypothetical protein